MNSHYFPPCNCPGAALNETSVTQSPITELHKPPAALVSAGKERTRRGQALLWGSRRRFHLFGCGKAGSTANAPLLQSARLLCEAQRGLVPERAPRRWGTAPAAASAERAEAAAALKENGLWRGESGIVSLCWCHRRSLYLHKCVCSFECIFMRY